MAEERAAQDAARLQSLIRTRQAESQRLRTPPSADDAVPMTALAQYETAARRRAGQLDRETRALATALEAARQAHRAALARRLMIEEMLKRQHATQLLEAKRKAIRRGL
ncbi:hypothetical protein FHS89_001247 [Rubricella aquisinus]|uniref:Flagellar FliJ protein n=1 Tax=Rubricella aquisinus TaxID=2028108 RepID=A0A840X3I6_9RHOB|nr:hypothetical protein [Rubricella aquisinus]MBB5515237.1 hypothetical protein [Rubricella aquisinus]